jgi:hypothetical protein
MTNQAAQKYIGATITLEADSAVLLHDRCLTRVIYRIRTANAEEYLHFNFRTPPSELGINEKEIDVLEIYCGENEINVSAAEPFHDLIIYKNEYLVDSWNGYFFFLKKQ